MRINTDKSVPGEASAYVVNAPRTKNPGTKYHEDYYVKNRSVSLPENFPSIVSWTWIEFDMSDEPNASMPASYQTAPGKRAKNNGTKYWAGKRSVSSIANKLEWAAELKEWMRNLSEKLQWSKNRDILAKWDREWKPYSAYEVNEEDPDSLMEVISKLWNAYQKVSSIQKK